MTILGDEMPKEEIEILRVGELFQHNDAMTHLGSLGTRIEHGSLGADAFQRESYTMHGVQWTVRDERDGKQYTLTLVPKR